jgi:hypothetical protein
VGNVTIRPSPLGSLLWPLAFAVVAGAAGGWWSARHAAHAGGDRPGAGSPASTARARRVAAAAGRGGVAMLLAGLALSVAGIVVLAVLRPDATSAYVRGVAAGGPGRAAALVGLQALALPNEAAFVLVPAMGGCDGAYGAGVDVNLVCLDRLPQRLGVELFTPESGPPAAVEPAPATLLLLLAVPAAATVVGGIVASRHAGALWPVASAAGAGVVFAALAGIVAFLAGVRASGELFNGASTGTVTYGPRPLVAVALALAWGIPGGVAGAVLDRRR